MVGTGFSRTKYSVRSRARPAFSFVSPHVLLMAVEIFLDARRNCSRPPELISPSPDWSGVGSGSSLVRSFSFGLIIQRNRKWRFGCVSQIVALLRSAGGPIREPRSARGTCSLGQAQRQKRTARPRSRNPQQILICWDDLYDPRGEI